MKHLKNAVAAALILAGCTILQAQNSTSQIKWFTADEAVKNPEVAYAVKITVNDDEASLALQIKKLSALPHITHLYIEIFGMMDVPVNINTLDELEELTIINQDWIIQPSDSFVKTQMEGKFSLVWQDSQKQYRVLKVTYVSFDEGLSKSEMAYFIKIFPDAQSSLGVTQPLVAEVTDKGQIEKMAYDKKYNYVKPPINGVDVPKSYYVVDALNGGIFRFTSGTTVSIPSLAFVDAKGKPVAGNVTVTYREFKDVAEMIVCGIPMTYDSGGVINHFESAGMFELLASQNGKELFLAKDKKIEMDFTSTSSAPSFNFYAFNDTTGNWNYISTAGQIKTSTNGNTIAYSDAWVFYLSRVGTGKNPVNFFKNVYDSTSFADRFESADYFYVKAMNKKAKVNKNFWTVKDKKKTALLRFYPVKRTKEGNVIFKIKWFNQSHPELSAFSGLSWMTDEKMTTAQFRNMVTYKNFFSDIRIEENGDGFTLLLKGSLGMKTINAHPVQLSSDKKKVTELKDGGTKRYKVYKRHLISREKFFNKRLKKGLLSNSTYKDFSNMLHLEGDELKKYWWKQARYQMTPTELAMDFSEWDQYVEELKENEKNNLENTEASTNGIIRSLTLDGFGIYNCDQIQRLKNGVSVWGKFINEEGKQVVGQTVYIVNKAIRGVLTYGIAQLIAFSKSTDNTMLVVKPDGTLSVAGPEEFKGKNFSNKGNYTFTLSDTGKDIKTVGDLRVIMGF